jgi:hypothetical protein
VSDSKQPDLGQARQQIENRIAQGQPIPPNMAVEAIMGGYAPPGMVVEGTIYLSHRRLPVVLPENLTAERVELSHASGVTDIPKGWNVKKLIFTHNPQLKTIAPDLKVEYLNLSQCTSLTELPDTLEVESLNLTGCTGLTRLPETIKVKHRLVIDQCPSIQTLPRGLRLQELSARGSGLTALPDDCQVTVSLDLTNCTELTRLPDGLKATKWVLTGCRNLEALPENLSAHFFDISNCSLIDKLPDNGSLTLGWLNMQNCFRIREIPAWVGPIAGLNVFGCASLHHLPDTLEVRSWIDIGGTQIASLPPKSQGAQIQWRSVPIDARIAFQPETITSKEVLAEQNAEKRRVLLERMGYERFMEQAEAKVLNEDTDRGGTRQLMRVEMTGDEPLVCLSVRDPSTGRQYLLRVPPTMTTCHQAAAWIAGFDNPSDYKPAIET